MRWMTLLSFCRRAYRDSALTGDHSQSSDRTLLPGVWTTATLPSTKQETLLQDPPSAASPARLMSSLRAPARFLSAPSSSVSSDAWAAAHSKPALAAARALSVCETFPCTAAHNVVSSLSEMPDSRSQRDSQTNSCNLTCAHAANGPRNPRLLRYAQAPEWTHPEG